MKLVKKNLFIIISVLLGIIAVCLLFIPSANLDGIDDATASGFQMIFGYSKEVTIIFVTTTVTYLKLSVGGLIAFILIILGILAGIVSIFIKSKLNLVAGLLLIIGAVLIFFLPNMANIPANNEQSWIEFTLKALPILYVTGVVTLLSGCISILNSFVKIK